jgi:hypothetical protein
VNKFKSSARVPDGVTPDGILAELDDIKERFGKATPEAATKAVLAEPERYPMLRAFGPANAEEAFERAIRDGITYAVRMIVHIEDDPTVTETRARFLVEDDQGDQVWEPMPVIVKNEKYQNQLIRELRGDASAFAQKLENVLAEIARIMGA